MTVLSTFGEDLQAKLVAKDYTPEQAHDITADAVQALADDLKFRTLVESARKEMSG